MDRLQTLDRQCIAMDIRTVKNDILGRVKPDVPVKDPEVRDQLTGMHFVRCHHDRPSAVTAQSLDQLNLLAFQTA